MTGPKERLRLTTKARILLVDDRHENLVALEAILSSLNQTLVTVGRARRRSRRCSSTSSR